MDFEIESSVSGYVVYDSEGSLKLKSRQSTVTSAECNDIGTRTEIILVVARAILLKRYLPHLSKRCRR